MNNFLFKLSFVSTNAGIFRHFSVSTAKNANYSCKLLVLGGGSGGCTMAAKFARRLKKDSVIVLEPSSDHYYQPLFTLVGAGVTSVSATRRSARSVLPPAARWMQDSAESIHPKENVVKTTAGHTISYEYLIVAVGLVYDYDKVPGLTEALKDGKSGVSTIYSPDYCEKTWSDLRNFKGGEAVFTYPDTPIKCPGAPQKIAYLADSYFTKTNVRSKSNITYNTCLPVIFGVKKYADALMKVVKRKNINVNYKTVLKEVRPDRREAVFYNVDDKTKESTQAYSLLHVTPPMRTPAVLQRAGADALVDAAGFLTVDKFSLQHTAYPNIYGIGDCTNTPNSKTAAAIAKQAAVVEYNLQAAICGQAGRRAYDGYGACPLVTSYNTCVLAEFLYDGVPHENNSRCKLLVVGGGTGGCSVAWRFSKKLNDKDIIILEPNKDHYYQPLFSLVGAGIKNFPECHKPLRSVLPHNVLWLRDHASSFDPCNNVVQTGCGFKVRYDHMVLAVGLVNDYDQILGLRYALSNPLAPASTIYSPEYCQKCWCCIQGFKGGHAIFTFPKRAGKCSGAAQKIMYLAHDFWKKNNINSVTNITYNTAGNSLFGVPKYAAALVKITNDRNIIVNYNLDLIEVTQHRAVFLDVNGQTIILPYKFLHVTPAMSPPRCLSECSQLVDDSGYLDLDHHTLQHRRYANIYGLGDCTNTPNSKTAAAVAKQSRVLELNLWDTMYGKEPSAKYDGYGACPMITSYKTGILAEFTYDKKPCETFPFDQSKERRSIYFLNKEVLPYIYWNKLIKGKWNGPTTLRKFINPLGR
ncbi:sulfide:quinone oxidoreductase, mitochondrial [Vanessa cardui]|uniref:sulfide:quinone oxidoreductase, mitochondrial n=1 Tax=Vanessa cardui TaxID=171605 RepID=UPI001F133D3F|nr:sulfide:quinone oxidoreductase, mitochondrial [Vanessa cardui]